MAFGFENPFARKPVQETKKEDEFAWNDRLNEQMEADGDKREVYGEDKVEGITAEFTSVAGEISVVLNRKNADGSTSQLHKKFATETKQEAESLFEELKKRIDAAAESGADKESIFGKAESLFN